MRKQCPQCLDYSEDNLVTHENGSIHCYACNYHESKKGLENTYANRSNIGLIPGIITELPARKLTENTCKTYNIRTAFLKNIKFNEEVYIFPYYKNNRVVKQKIKSRIDRTKISQYGDTKLIELFGKQLFSPTKSLPCIITEGEFDAPSIWQTIKLPAVSISRGSGTAAKDLSDNHIYNWLCAWREIILCFDMDGPGQDAVQECIKLFEPGFVKVVNLPYKDANEMLLQGKEIELKQCIQRASVQKPKTVVWINEIIDEVLVQPQYGSPWPWEFMTKATFGNRRGEIYILAGDTSCGKTQIVYEIVLQQLNNNAKVQLIDLERGNTQTAQRLIGMKNNQLLYQPGCKDWDAKFIRKEIEKYGDKIALYRPESGKLSLDEIIINIRWLYKASGVTFFVLDNLVALSAMGTEGMKDYEYASVVVGKLSTLAKELQVTIFIINHLTKSRVQLVADITMGEDFVYNPNKEGLTWETGRMPELNDIFGGKQVGILADYVIVVARNRMSVDINIQRTAILKFLKTRFENSYEGRENKIRFDPTIHRLIEVK